MNTIPFKVNKNIIQKIGGYSIASSENNYTKFDFQFSDDWNKVGIQVSATMFFDSDKIPDPVLLSMRNDNTGYCYLPSALKDEHGILKLGLTGAYVDDNNEKVVINTLLTSMPIGQGAFMTKYPANDIYKDMLARIASFDKSKQDRLICKNGISIDKNSSISVDDNYVITTGNIPKYVDPIKKEIEQLEENKTNKIDVDNKVSKINESLEKKEEISNKVDVIDISSTIYYPSTKAILDYINSKFSEPLSDIQSLKADKFDKADFNIYKTSNDNAVAKNFTDIVNIQKNINNISSGSFDLQFDFKKGSVDKTTGEIKDGSAFITDKVDLSQFSKVEIRTDRSTLYASVFEYDSLGDFVKIVADTKNQIAFEPTENYKYIIWLWYGGTDISKIAKAHIKGKSINTIAENDVRYELAKEVCKLDLPDSLYVQKGGTLELFKYGMYLSTSEYVENKYNVRLVNMSGYITEYSDKIVIKCPTDYDSDLLRKPNDLPLFQLLNNEGKVIDSKRVKIYVTDISKIHNITKNIMYLGDSLTGMGYRSAEMANLIKSANLTNVKLIGRSIGQGTGNRFTGTGGYTWANYTENPNTLPAAYGNNYLWVNEYNNISMGHFVKYDLGESQLDYLIILLGWNDYESGAFSSSFNWQDLKMRARKLIENTHASFPSCKIILEGYHYMYPHNRQSYGNSMPQIRQNRYIYDLNRVYESLAKEYEYVTFVQMSNRIDVIHNMPMKEVTANKRNKTLVSYCTDCVHPAESGFNQYADAEFDSILYLMATEQEEGE